jgi:hypothetical protein
VLTFFATPALPHASLSAVRAMSGFKGRPPLFDSKTHGKDGCSSDQYLRRIISMN